MEDETRTIVWVLATILLVVAAGYAGFASVENHLMAGKAVAAGAHPVVVHAVERRSIILLVFATLFWIAAAAVFGQALPQRPGTRSPRYAVSAGICALAIGIMVVVLHVTATLLKLV
jgi:hypothetical protein